MKKFTAIILALVLMFSMSAMSLTAAGGSTAVTITIDATQISVTVPTTLPITAFVDGGPAKTVPSDYKITNNSLIPIKVDTIAVELADSTDWAFSADALAVGAAQGLGEDAGKNLIYLSVNGEVLSVHSARATTTPASWDITAGGDLSLPIVCSTSKLDQTTTESNLITITYVISAGSYISEP